jgi:hypothetical protein
MDTKAVLACRKKINELAIQHNKLTTLTAALLNEILSIKRELQESRNGGGESRGQGSAQSGGSASSNKQFPNFNELRAEDILKQLSINTVDN